MRVRILVEVVDDDGECVRKQTSAQVSEGILGAHKVVCESRSDLLGFVLQDVVSSAIAAVASPQAPKAALEEAISGRGPSGRREGGESNKLEKMLGLDIIERMDRMESRGAGGQRKMTPGDLALPQGGTRR
jgi:hypothetical protein